MVDYTQGIREYISEERRVVESLNVDAINIAMNALVENARAGKTIWVMGNGGSAATASHFVCDFNKGVFQATGLPFNMVCLSDNTPIATAISNDISYDEVFVFQMRGKVHEGDLVLAISGSGNSGNVIKAVEYAKEMGARVIGLTGYDGGKLKELSDCELHVPADNMQFAEDIHMMFDHLMMYVLCHSAADGE